MQDFPESRFYFTDKKMTGWSAISEKGVFFDNMPAGKQNKDYEENNVVTDVGIGLGVRVSPE